MRWARPTRNFYNDAFARQGYGDDVREVQRLWLAGDKRRARRRVPIAIGLGTNLIGTDDMMRDRLRLYRDAGITTLRAGLGGDDLDTKLSHLAHLLDLIGEINAEMPATQPAPESRANNQGPSRRCAGPMLTLGRGEFAQFGLRVMRRRCRG